MSSEIPKLNLITAPLSGKYKNLIFILTLVALVGVGVGGFSFYQYQRTQKELQAIKKVATASQNTNTDQLSKILLELSKIIKLPEGEIPTMATISDIGKLKDQPFFQNGKNGDILLVFNKAGKAILYNPTDKKIVEVAPVSNTVPSGSAGSTPLGSPKSTPSPSPTPTPIQPKILLRNGTISPALSTKVEAEIKKSFPQVTIVGKENAARNTYDRTTVVILNTAQSGSAQEIAKTLKMTVADLPSAEKKPTNADILIILGTDKI